MLPTVASVLQHNHSFWLELLEDDDERCGNGQWLKVSAGVVECPALPDNLHRTQDCLYFLLRVARHELHELFVVAICLADVAIQLITLQICQFRGVTEAAEVKRRLV
jgi:hypothetical protein